MNIIGTHIGRLEIIDVDPNKKDYLICRCQCGNTVSVKAYNLTKQNHTRSCGCLRADVARDVGLKNLQKAHEINRKYNTKFQVIECSHRHKNNTSGYTGVYFNSVSKKYVAYINVHGKRINLGPHKKLDDAVAARKEAEEKYYAPLIAAKNEMHATKGVIV